MSNRNGALNAHVCECSSSGGVRTWAIVLGVFVVAFALSAALAVAAPSGWAFAEGGADAPANAVANDANVDVDGAANGGSVEDSDITLTPTDSDGLKADEAADGASETDDPDQPVEITVTVVDAAGKIQETFNIEKGKTITFVDEKDNVLAQYVAEAPTVTAPDAPAKDGYDFAGWSAKVNDKGNAVITAQYKEKSNSGTTDDVKTVRSSNGTVTTNSPKTGDLLSIALPVGVAVVALIAILVLLFARRRN